MCGFLIEVALKELVSVLFLAPSSISVDTTVCCWVRKWGIWRPGPSLSRTALC